MRPQGMNGLLPIHDGLIYDWSRLHRRHLSDWAIKMILIADLIYRAAYYKAISSRKAGAPSQT